MSANQGSWTLEISHPYLYYYKNPTPTELGPPITPIQWTHGETEFANLCKNKGSLLLHTGLGLLVGFGGTLWSGPNKYMFQFVVVCLSVSRNMRGSLFKQNCLPLFLKEFLLCIPFWSYYHILCLFLVFSALTKHHTVFVAHSARLIFLFLACRSGWPVIHRDWLSFPPECWD